MLEVGHGHKYHPAIPSAPIATFWFCFLLHLPNQALFTAFLGSSWSHSSSKGDIRVVKWTSLKREVHAAIYTSQKNHERGKPAATLATSLPLEEQSPCPSSVLLNSSLSLQLPHALCWMMGNCCLRPGHLFVGHGAINILQEERKTSRFFFILLP